jgi:hypothetical protein
VLSGIFRFRGGLARDQARANELPGPGCEGEWMLEETRCEVEKVKDASVPLGRCLRDRNKRVSQVVVVMGDDRETAGATDAHVLARWALGQYGVGSSCAPSLSPSF